MPVTLFTAIGMLATTKLPVFLFFRTVTSSLYSCFAVSKYTLAFSFRLAHTAPDTYTMPEKKNMFVC